MNEIGFIKTCMALNLLYSIFQLKLDNMQKNKAVLFDLLTALLDSWTVWNRAAGSAQAGRAWRAQYLRLTYSCGAYVPYETLVLQAAANTGLDTKHAQALEDVWPTLPVWSGAQEALEALAPNYLLGVVTNCSTRLGRLAAQRLNITWDCIVTAQEAGYYKPHPAPYQRALQALGVGPQHTVFVAGSGYDLFGTAAVGLPTFWHNRVGLPLPEGAPPAHHEASSLEGLVAWVHQQHQPTTHKIS
jgi:2-haloacid dehalogenase